MRAKASALRQGKDSLQATTTVIGKGQQESRDLPRSLTILTEKLISDRRLDTLKAALHNAAGISFQAAEGGEEDIRLRGYSLAATGDIFVDGVRDPAYCDRDTFNHDRLELLRGSASMLFGRGSSGGAVNQVSKVPLLYGRNELSVTLGNNGYGRGTADLSQRLGESSALRLNLMSILAEAGGQRIDKQGLAASVGLGIGSRDKFALGLYHLQNNNGNTYGMPWVAPVAGSSLRTLVPVDPACNYAAASERNDGSAHFGTLQPLHRLGGGNEIKTALRLGRYERDLRASAIRFWVRSVNAGTGVVINPDCPSSTPTLATLSEATVLTRGNNKIQGLATPNLQSDLNYRFQALGAMHQLLAGVDAAKERLNNFGAASLA